MSNGLTLREIARLAKVSTATVSRAINRVPTVNPVLARRIRKVIEKEGYFPNTNARALVRGCSRSLGLIVSEITNPFSGKSCKPSRSWALSTITKSC